jgi:preprotein translocase subunit SecG
MLINILLVVFMLSAVVMVVLILLQQGKVQMLERLSEEAVPNHFLVLAARRIF